jgi:hypothetical protein
MTCAHPARKEARDHEGGTKGDPSVAHTATQGCRQVKSPTVFVRLPQCAISFRTVDAALCNGAKGKERKKHG